MNKKTFLILVLCGVTLAGYFSARALRAHACSQPGNCNPVGLQWLKDEFQLSDTQFAKIRALHESYAPECCARCCELQAAERQLSLVLESNTSVSPEVISALQRVDMAASESRRAMLKHIYAVSREMEPGQGRRFIEKMSRHLAGNDGDASQSGNCP